MSTHKHIDLICVVVLLLALALTLLFMNGTALGLQAVVDEDAEQNSDSAWFTSADLSGTWDRDHAVTITLEGESGTISGNGAYFLHGDLVINGSGSYVLTGTLSDGSIIVDADSSAKVHLVLEGVEITNSEDACLLVKQADKVFLTLAEGSENTFISASAYSDAAVEDGVDGVIYAKDDLTINGAGSLTITGGWKHGIAANDDLVITGGTLTVEAVQDALHANDSLRICNAALNLTAGDDGIAVTNEETGEGYFYMESGALNITCGDDGIHTAGDITIAGGDLTIYAGDDGIHSDTGVLVSGGTVNIPQCYEGIEAVTIEQTGGDITIYPTDDGLNANGGSGNGFGGGFGGGMNFTPRSSDTTGSTDSTTDSEQPTASDFNSESGEMPTPPDFNSESGEMPTPPDFNSGDSGAEPSENSSQRTDGAEAQPAAESDTTDTVDEETWIRISGGTLTIINKTGRDADGLDSNGDIYISGGTVFISLLGDGSNSAIDYGSESGGVAEISGGTVIACGGSSMAERFSGTSTQPSFLYNLTEAVQAGTTLTLTDSSGTVLLTCELPCSASAITMSCPELELGQTYTLTMGEQSQEITLDSVSVSLGTSSGMGGFVGMGNMGAMGGGRQGGFGGRGRFRSSAGDDAGTESTDQSAASAAENP